MTCWHCSDLGSCHCLCCVKETATGQTAGPCQACKGRRRADLIRPFLIAHDIEPGDRKWWVLVGNKRDQGAPKPKFLGDQLFDEHMGGLK